jgi:hypothetical protein
MSRKTYWTVEVKSGAYTHRKGVCVTQTDARLKDVDENYVRNEVLTLQAVTSPTTGLPRFPIGEIVSIKRRDPNKPVPAHIGSWEHGGIAIQDTPASV